MPRCGTPPAPSTPAWPGWSTTRGRPSRRPGVTPLGNGTREALLVARDGEDFDDDEHTLLRAMARVLGLALRHGRLVAAERALRARSDALARIQRKIALRVPLQDVLDAIVGEAGDLLGDELPALLLIDPDDPGRLTLVASRGISPDVMAATRHRRLGVGVSGRAAQEGRLIVVDDYANDPGAIDAYVEMGLQAAMAAPVHEDGVVIGSLLVSTYTPGRTYTPAEQDTLEAFAGQASLALNDARAVNRMVHQAMHDSLTGLPNRALFLDRLEHALTHSARRGSDVAVLFCDLDRFKTVNDSLGHAAGDELLAGIARRLGGCMRASDTAARLGGDEFAVLLEDVRDRAEAVSVAERIAAALRDPLDVQGREIRMTASIGIAVGRAVHRDMLRNADVAMYRAKAAGPGRWAIFEDAMQVAVMERMELEADLDRALRNHEIEVFYQPIVRIDGCALAGFEALARWRHPARGIVGPDSFIGLAEDLGLICDLGRLVLETACRQAAAWRAAHPGASSAPMHVNLSGHQLDDPALVGQVSRALESAGLPPSGLVLEITETVLMQDTETTIARLGELRSLGVRLAIDDFGTGYSSLRYLRRFPVDTIKMAKPFVDGLGTGAEGDALARTIIDLAASLGLRVVAEGIETLPQLRYLRRMECELGQGFLLAKPMTALELSALMVAPEPNAPWRMPPAAPRTGPGS